MYFNDKKNNTNIDDDFDNKQNILSLILSFISRYKKIVIISSVALILLIIILFLTSNMDITATKYLELNGEEVVTIYQDSDYIEPGYKAYNSKEEDLKSEVVVETNLNNKVIGEYEIIYTLGNTTKKRTVKVIAKPKEYTYIHLTSVEKGTTDVYVKSGEKYTEPGYMVFSSTGTDLTNKVMISGEVNINKKGTYKLIYSILDSRGVTISTSRNIIVLDSDVNLSLSTSNYTNKDITINIEVIDEYFDYIILPDNTKITVNKYTYKVNQNGKYTFKTTNKKGMTKESSIEVKNIDKTAPSGSCSGNYKDGVSSIKITAKDNSGISKYVINNKNYTSNQITINSELKTVNVTIYDKANNTKNISCILEDKNEIITSDKSISFSYQYVSNGDTIPYGLYTPSSASKGKQIPLIIWLHGLGEVENTEAKLKNSGLLKVLNEWQLEGFNAYVLCPHLAKETRLANWNNETAKNKIDELLDKIIKQYNIDKEKIVLSGHSLGAIGVEYITYNKPKYFSAMVVLSGYNNGYDLSKIKETGIPVLGFVGGPQVEHSPSYKYMRGDFAWAFGSENVTMYYTAFHDHVPRMAFTEDKNGDNKSDLIEWMLTQKRSY